MAGLGWFVKGHNARLRRIEGDIGSVRAKQVADDAARQKDLSQFSLDSEKRFAKEESVQHSLDRIHSRLDDIVGLIVKQPSSKH